MMLADQLKACGVVGAGGGGFPAHIKAASKTEYVIANGAECEPLVHKDVELMRQFPGEVVEGMTLLMEATGARQGFFAIKKKQEEAIGAVGPHLQEHGIEFSFLGDFYPSGDEYEVVYAATGRLIPPGGIPLQIGCVVNNVETLYNISMAARDIPVTQKFVSITGAVKRPVSVKVPIGTSFRKLLEIAGGATVPEIALFVSGIMMGTLSFDLEDVVTKTTAGLIVLPVDHNLVRRRSQPRAAMDRIGRSACDQCRYCTEFCPRYLLGYEVEPHRVMRSLGFTSMGTEHWSQWAELCCGCGICTLYACPEDLYPKEACIEAKFEMRSVGIKFAQTKEVRVHPMKDGRRVPQSQLRRKLGIQEYEAHAPFDDVKVYPKKVRIKLSQHAGKPASPIVRVGDEVRTGRLIASIGEKDLGAPLHASIDGTITQVTDTFIEIQAS